jgi:hypothetical protein
MRGSKGCNITISTRGIFMRGSKELSGEVFLERKGHKFRFQYYGYYLIPKIVDSEDDYFAMGILRMNPTQQM